MNGISGKNSIRLLIADDDKAFAQTVRDYFACVGGYEIVGCVHNGKDALRLIRETAPDAVILDLVMPYYDGYGVLEALQKDVTLKMPYFILLSALPPEVNSVREAMADGKLYYMMKPIELGIVDHRLKQAVAAQPERKVMPAASPAGLAMLRQMGIPLYSKGYLYLSAALALLQQDRSLLTALTKELYPAVAESFEVSAESVERCIRQAIAAAWERDEGESIKRVFAQHGVMIGNRPTNAEMLAFLSDIGGF